MADPLLLRAADVSKAYAGVQALSHASFDLRAGEAHALVGENGAGKSTFIRILTGAEQPDAGEIFLRGQPFAHSSPRAAKAQGIVAVYQQPTLFPELTVTENLAIAVEPAVLWRRVDWRVRRERARSMLAAVGAQVDPDADAAALSRPQQQLVEIARALGADAKVLILDEPTASLSDSDASNLIRVLGEVRARGVGVIYISHRLEELPRIADRVTVLRDGCTIGTHTMAAVNREQLIRMMVGREIAVASRGSPAERGEPVLELRGLGCRASGVREVSLSVHAGEIVGLAGLVGAGRTELACAVFGVTPADAGEIRMKGREVHIRNPSDAIACGIAYVPEDRRRHGTMMEMSVGANVTLAALDKLSRFGALDRRRERELAVEYCGRLAVKTPSIFTRVSALSGGNQQKVALSRWLVTNPSLLILDEPTQGIDVGAKGEIHARVKALAAEGVAILMISSDLPEVLGMSDRIGVMRDGMLVDMLDGREATAERILTSTLGGAAGSAAAAGNVEPV